MSKKKNAGFGWPQNSRKYPPVRLKIRTHAPIYLCGGCVPCMKTLNTRGKWQEVLCMNGQTSAGGYGFFIRENNDFLPYMVSRGEFEIRFEAKPFFAIVDKASKKNASTFFEHAAVSVPSELVVFSQMIAFSGWDEQKKIWARERLKELAETT